MAQRIVEMLIGRLVTDEQFRLEFLEDPNGTLQRVCDLGWELSQTELAALVDTERALWGRMSDGLDPRLQKISLKHEARNV